MCRRTWRRWLLSCIVRRWCFFNRWGAAWCTFLLILIGWCRSCWIMRQRPAIPLTWLRYFRSSCIVLCVHCRVHSLVTCWDPFSISSCLSIWRYWHLISCPTESIIWTILLRLLLILLFSRIWCIDTQSFVFWMEILWVTGWSISLNRVWSLKILILLCISSTYECPILSIS